MFQGADDLLAYIKEEGIETVDVRFCDLPGVMQHFTVPAGSFGPEVFEEGLNFDGDKLFQLAIGIKQRQHPIHEVTARAVLLR